MAGNTTFGILFRLALVLAAIGALGGYGLHYLENQVLTQENLKEMSGRLPSSNFLDLVFQGNPKETNTTPTDFEEIVVPLIKQGRSLFVRVELNDFREATLLVDTGATETVLSTDVAFDLGLLDEEAQEVTYNTAGGQVQAQVTELETIRVGDAVRHQVPAAIQNIDGFSDGLLGMSFFEHFLVYVDSERGELHLRPRDY